MRRTNDVGETERARSRGKGNARLGTESEVSMSIDEGRETIVRAAIFILSSYQASWISRGNSKEITLSILTDL